MKKAVLFLLMLIIVFISYGQSSDTPPPTAELTHYTIKESLPAFIVFSGAKDFLNIDTLDYYFTYDSSMYCRGGYYSVYDYASGFGDDPNTTIKEGFYYNEAIFCGFFDYSENKYFELKTDQKLTYKSLGLYYVTDFRLGDEIQLNVNSDLIKTVLHYKYLPYSFDIYKDANLFFSIVSENMIEVETTILNGSGELLKVDRFVNGHFVNRQYKAAQTDALVVFKTTGKNNYTREYKEIFANIVVTNTRPAPIPQPTEEKILYSDVNIKVESRPSKWGAEIWVENKTTEPIIYYFTFKKKDGGYVTNSNSRRALQGGQEVRALLTRDLYDTLYVNRIKLGGNIIQINEIIEL